MYKLFDYRRTMYSLLHDIMTSGTGRGYMSLGFHKYNSQLFSVEHIIIIVKNISVVFVQIKDVNNRTVEKKKEKFNNM